MSLPVLREMTAFGRVVLLATLAVSLVAIAMEYLLGVHGSPVFIVSALGILGLA
jgi:hypothetical protein